MGFEVERKFLVKNKDFKKDAYGHKHTKQGYLCTDPARTVRIRIQEATAYITIKGNSSSDGTTRYEWEKEISVKEAEQLLKLSVETPIEKIRYYVKKGRHLFEIDEFLGENEGLILAEVELSDPNESFEKPHWLDKEVTGESKYYNAQLSITPYSYWDK